MSDKLPDTIYFTRKLKTGPLSRKSKIEVVPPNIRLVIPLNINMTEDELTACVRRKYFPGSEIISEEEYLRKEPVILKEVKEPEELKRGRDKDYIGKIVNLPFHEFQRYCREIGKIREEYYKKKEEVETSRYKHEDWERDKFVMIGKEPKFYFPQPRENASEKEVEEYNKRKDLFEEQKKRYEYVLRERKEQECMFKVFNVKKGDVNDNNNSSKKNGFSNNELFEKIISLCEKLYLKGDTCYEREFIRGKDNYEYRNKKIDYNDLRVEYVRSIEDEKLRELDTPIYFVKF